jgi:hypothetical protein
MMEIPFVNYLSLHRVGHAEFVVQTHTVPFNVEFLNLNNTGQLKRHSGYYQYVYRN